VQERGWRRKELTCTAQRLSTNPYVKKGTGRRYDGSRGAGTKPQEADRAVRTNIRDVMTNQNHSLENTKRVLEKDVGMDDDRT